MPQIYSRPGFKTMYGDNPRPAQLQDDMIPAINRPAPEDKPVQPKTLDLSHRKLKNKPIIPPADVTAAAAKAGPELILNPEPSATPKVLEPGK